MTPRLVYAFLALSACAGSRATSPIAPAEISWGGPSSFMVDTNGDGLPDTVVPSGGTFVDTDDDGLPDIRLDTFWTNAGPSGCNAMGMTAIRAAFAKLDLATDQAPAMKALDDLLTRAADAQRHLRAHP